MHKILYITAFLTGFVLMSFELLGARIIAPYFGSSLITWSSLIGIILFSISFGYLLGGKYADRKPKLDHLALILLLCAFSIAAVGFLKDNILNLIHNNISNLKVKTVFGILILFFAPGFLIGCSSPYILKIALKDLKQTGTTAGRIYAISTLGSILGTFLTGFMLIPNFGHVVAIIFCSMLLLLNAITIFLMKRKLGSITMLILVVITIFINIKTYGNHISKPYIDEDSAYNRILIFEDQNTNTRVLQLNNHINGAIYLDSNELVYEYNQVYFKLISELQPKKILILGGGAFNLPRYLSSNYGFDQLDIVEIDPKLVDLSVKHFAFEKSKNVNIYVEDARNFLLKNSNSYDLIIWDVFTSPLTAPYQMTTSECLDLMNKNLNPNGSILSNILGSLEGQKSIFLRGIVNTGNLKFKNISLFPVYELKDRHRSQNIILRLSNQRHQTNIPGFSMEEFNGFEHSEKAGALIFTDDYCPVNYLLSQQ
ncbi:MAG: fused MFS/spermidine synthase [Flavobacteriales bacterium]|nr:fused MFS/spermidine synthase [Flavobacteriales bacterium]